MELFWYDLSAAAIPSGYLRVFCRAGVPACIGALDPLAALARIDSSQCSIRYAISTEN
jgi:hypothetical protein